MNEVVKYHNDLNNISLGGFTENQINILFTIFAKIKNKDTKEINFNLDEIIELSGISTTNKEYLETSIFSCFDKIQNLKIRYVDDEESKVQEVIFPKAKINKDRTQLTIKVSKAFAYIFNNLIGNFTRFELAEFVSLDSRYAKTLYRLLKQYRKKGILNIKWEKFKEIMNIPTSYKRIQDIEKDIIKVAIKKLSSEQTLFDQKRTLFFDLKYKKLKTKGKGNKITHIEFTFKAENKENKTTTQEKENNNKELKENHKEKQSKYKKYIGQYAKYYDLIQKILKIEEKENRLIAIYYNEDEKNYFRMDFNNLEHLERAIREAKEYKADKKLDKNKKDRSKEINNLLNEINNKEKSNI